MATRINIETIPQENHRYETVGDYFYDQSGVLQVRVTDMGNEFYEKMVIIHELIEEALTKFRGLTEQQIMDFDLYYEKRRLQGFVGEFSEPGFDKNCPYRNEHTLSTSVEMQMCAMAGVSWDEYDQFINQL